MAWKAWDDLSPAYRQRLIRKKITPQMHALAKPGVDKTKRVSLKAARGKGANTPAEMKRRETSERKRHASETYQKLIKQGRQLFISERDVIIFADFYGTQFTKLLLDFKAVRHAIYVRDGMKSPNQYNVTDIKKWAINNNKPWKDEWWVYIKSLDYDTPFIRYQEWKY